MSRPLLMHGPGVIRRIRYGFALVPRWTFDLGWTWLNTFQTIVVEHPPGCFETRRLGHSGNWFTRSWSTRTAQRNDAEMVLAYEPEEEFSQ